jgi:glycosyltransferase involved in cell wall biosynthesis
VIIAPPLDTVPSPGGNAIYTLVEELALGLPEPTLVLARWPEEGSPIAAPISNQILYDTRPLKPGWLQQRLPYRLKRAITGSGAPFYYEYAQRAAQLSSRLKATRIIIEDIPVFAPEIKRYLEPHQSLFLHQHNNALKSMSHRFSGKVTRSLDGVIFAACHTLLGTEEMHGKLSIPAEIIHNGVDLTHYDRRVWQGQADRLRQTLGILPTEKVLLYVGRIVPDKGIAEAVEAFLSACVPASHFVVVGDPENSLYGDKAYAKRLRSTAQQAPKIVHLVGRVEQSEIPAHYALADIAIIPSRGNEGLPKVITEALAMQVPCIVTQRGGALELIQHGANGWVVPEPATAESMSATIQRAFGQQGQVKVQASTREAMSIGRMIAEFSEFINMPKVSVSANQS